MALRFRCEHCGKRLQVEMEPGASAMCPYCRNVVVVPADAQTVAAKPAGQPGRARAAPARARGSRGRTRGRSGLVEEAGAGAADADADAEAGRRHSQVQPLELSVGTGCSCCCSEPAAAPPIADTVLPIETE